MQTVDVHTHFFNVLYLPVEGILQRRGLPDGIAVWLGGALRDLARQRSSGFLGLEALPEVPRDTTGYEGLMDALIETSGVPESAFAEGVTVDAQSMWRLIRRLLRGAEALVSWLTLLTRSEQDLLAAARSIFPETRLFVNHLMALDSYYSLNPPEYDFDEQVARSLALGEDILHFVGFDPSLGDAAVEQVDSAVAAGFRGVKVYPPNGYRATGNAGARLYPGLDPSEIDNAFSSLFEFCGDRIPLFAHCSPGGFEAHRGFGLNSHPEFWGEAMDAYGGQSAKLCLGHAGGTEGWLADDVLGFAEAAIDLSASRESVYIEFGHFEEIIWSAEHRASMIDRFNELVPRGSSLEQRVMFGSDWHVSAAIDDVAGYPAAFREVLADRDSSAINGFFSDNAGDYLGPE